MRIKKLNESSLVDKKVKTLGKAGKPMYFTNDQLDDAKAKYSAYDFEETTIDKSLPQGQKAYVAKLKEDVDDPDEVINFIRAIDVAEDLDDIQHLIWSLSDGVAEDVVQRAFDTASDEEDLQKVKDAVIHELDIYLDENEWLGESASNWKKITEDIDDSSELEANKMTIMPLAGLNADGFTVIINDAAGEELFKKEYRYGHNASYDRRFAQWAEKDHEDSIKYGWKNPRALKPYVADIVDDLCSKYGIDKNSIEFVPGKNTFTGDSVTSDFVDTMKKRVYEATTTKLMNETSDTFTTPEGKELKSSHFVKLFKDAVKSGAWHKKFGEPGKATQAEIENANKRADRLRMQLAELFGYSQADIDALEEEALSEPISKNFFEESVAQKEKVFTKKNGDYLVRCENGGHSAYSSSDVFLGHINDEDTDEASFKFEKNRFDESKSIKTFGAKGKKLNENVVEELQPGEWVEVDLNVKKDGKPNIIPVKVDKELPHGYSFLGWAWGERQHEYNKSSIKNKIEGDDVDAIIRKYSLNEAADYKVKFFQVFEAPKSPKENGKMIGQRGTLDDANAFGKERVGEGNYIIKAVCDDGKTRNIDNDADPSAYTLAESIEVATIADYITDHYEFDDIDDKYGCINSIRDSFKDEKTISWEELEQFIGAHNGRDKVEEALTEDKGQPRSNRYTTYFNRIKRAIERGDEETLQRTKEAIMYAPAKELKNSEASELMHMIKNRKINEASYGGAFDIADDQYFTREDLMSFADEVLGHVSETFNGLYDIGGVWFEDGHVITQIVNDSGDEYEDKTKVDMRRIREPWHLKRMYAFPVAANIIKQIEENDADVITENIRGMGEYSDKFHDYLNFLMDEGKQDNIAYLASQLIRYCKEEDLKDLWLDRMSKTAEMVGFEASSNDLDEGLMDEFHKAQRWLDFEIPDACKSTADKLPNMTEQDMAAINKHSMKFKDVLDYYSTKASSSNEALEERFDGETHKVVAVAFDVIAPIGMTESEIEEELTDAINKSKVEVSGGYMEVHTFDESLTESATDAEPIETGAAVGMAAVVSDLIKDEYEAIDGYNSAIATAEAEGYEDAVRVLTEIQAEENIHVGQLQEVMKLFDPNADKVDEGQAEGAEQLNNSAETPNNNIEESADMKKERWEEIYDSFKTVEKELNQDGEAVTAVVDQMYRDNKSDPDYKKAYDKWASGE